MIILVCFALAVLSVPLCGGQLGKMSELRLRQLHLIVTAVMIQTLVISFVAHQVPHWMAVGIHLYSYVLALSFVGCNWHISGLPLLALGAVLNTTAIVFNGGVMPASAWAQRTAGLSPATARFANSDLADDQWFIIFGDMFAIPEGLPFANVFSIGDVLIVIGAGVILHRASESRLAVHRRAVLRG